MSKIIYQVEFDKIFTPEGVFKNEYNLFDEYEHEGNKVIVTNIEELITCNIRTVVVHFSDGVEHEIYNVSDIYRKIKK